MPMADIAARLELSGLQKAGHELVGPCPNCGGTDRFGINLRKGVFGCRRCGGRGGGVDLVMFVLRMEFPAALEWLCGPRQEISEEERQRRARIAEANAKEKQAEAERFRAKAIADARKIWNAGQPAEGTAVRDYLTIRGIRPELFPIMPKSLRFHADLPYMVELGPQNYAQAHRGPAMLAVVQGADGQGTAVHRTWLDLTRPNGKAEIVHPKTGKSLSSKKLLGSKKGGAIRLLQGSGDALVMGEGIETTVSGGIVDAIPGASYWAGVDLGNMSGQRVFGRGLRYAGIPDMTDDEAFVPPPWVRRLIFIQDGDSDPRDTRAKLLAGLRRAMLRRPGLRAQIVHADAGSDLNDVLIGDGDNG